MGPTARSGPSCAVTQNDRLLLRSGSRRASRSRGRHGSRRRSGRPTSRAGTGRTRGGSALGRAGAAGRARLVVAAIIEQEGKQTEGENKTADYVSKCVGTTPFVIVDVGIRRC